MPSKSNQLYLQFQWLDPQDAGGVLNNPNACMQVGIYYDSGTLPSGQSRPSGRFYISDPANGALCATADTGSESSAMLTGSWPAPQARPGSA